MTRIIVLAKSPQPGLVKTRLCPPCSPEEAADIAEAALTDTLHTATKVAETTVVLDGAPGPWLPAGVRVIPQRAGSHDERIAGAFVDVGTPALLIGMDTPQMTRRLLAVAIETLSRPRVDAVLGQAIDGGWWTAGLRSFVPEAFIGVPMSTGFTGRAQLLRFRSLGWNVELLPRLRDVDTFDDALAVAAHAPHTRFAEAIDAVTVATAESSA